MIDKKTLKKMIKEHKVRQTYCFVWGWNCEIGESHLSRFYEDKETGKMYLIEYYIASRGTVYVQDVYEVPESKKEEHWNSYIKQVNEFRALSDDQQAEIIYKCMENSRNAPMSQRKFWKVKAGVYQFMQKDNRIAGA